MKVCHFCIITHEIQTVETVQMVIFSKLSFHLELNLGLLYRIIVIFTLLEAFQKYAIDTEKK